MFEKKTQIQKDCKTTADNIIDLIKIVEKSQDLVALTGIYEALFKGKIQVPALAKQLEPKIQEVEIDEAPISTTEKTVTQKVNSLTAGTYFVENKNVIAMRKELKRLGLSETHTVTKTAGIDHGVFPRKDKNGKVIGSTNKFNEAMTQNKTLMVLVKNGKASAWDRSKQ